MAQCACRAGYTLGSAPLSVLSVCCFCRITRRGGCWVEWIWRRAWLRRESSRDWTRSTLYRRLTSSTRSPNSGRLRKTSRRQPSPRRTSPPTIASENCARSWRSWRRSNNTPRLWGNAGDKQQRQQLTTITHLHTMTSINNTPASMPAQSSSSVSDL